jgi:hypothetical protein
MLWLVAIVAGLCCLTPFALSPGFAQEKKHDVSGTWKWSYEGFGGNVVDVTLKLKQDGEKLTGTITNFQGDEEPIEDGKVKGEEIIFKIVRDFGGQRRTTVYTGKLSGETLKGKSETILTREFEAKRAQS